MIDGSASLMTVAAIVVPLVAGVLLQLARTDDRAHNLNRVFAVVAAAVGLAAGSSMLVAPRSTHWLMMDTAAGIYVCVITVTAVLSALMSPAYLTRSAGQFFADGSSVRRYYLCMYAFWAALIAIPVVANLGVAWLVVEASTAASAVLVAHTGKARALEAGWKYLVLTTLGLSLAFLGIVLLFVVTPDAGGGLAQLNWSALDRAFARMPGHAAVVAYALVMLGLAAKIGWAPVHNWLPDAHSEAPAPISAMLSSALLPAVMLLAWRLRDAAIEPLGAATANAPFFAFGIVSVAVAVAFLWQPLAWKRLLAYSSLEHMGIIALGIAFGSQLALAGVVIHVAGHALAKALGFYAAITLYEIQPEAGRHPARSIAQRSPVTFVAMCISIVTLAGLPPAPLFFSEVFIILGGIESGHAIVAIALALLISVAFIGVLRALLVSIEANPAHDAVRSGPERISLRGTPVAVPALVTAVGLSTLAGCAWWLPGSGLVQHLSRGVA